jgi:putative endopeptidase
MVCGAGLVALLVQAGSAQADAAPAGTHAAGMAKQLHALVEAAQQDTQSRPGSDQQRIADFYASYMDVARLEKLGYRPLIGELQRIRVLRDRRGLPQVFAHLSQIGVALPYAIKVTPVAAGTTATSTAASTPSSTASSGYVAQLVAGPPGMPNLAAYLPQGDQGLQAMRASYLTLIEKMLALGGTRDAAASAREVLALETKLAALRHQSAAPAIAAIDKLGAIAPGYDWGSALGAAGVSTKTDIVVIDAPGYLAGFARLANEAELASWKAYLEWQLLRSYAPYLSRAFAAAHATFYSMPPVGQPDLRPRWQAGAELVSMMLPELVGRQYVARHFPPERKAQFERIAAGQLAACVPPVAAEGKPLRAKVGYPAKWPGSGALTVSPAELAGNVMRARQLDYLRAIARLGSAIDRDEWTSAPHETRIFYDPARNEIVLPAAALQPPLVDDQAGEAAIAAALAARIREACATAVAR